MDRLRELGGGYGGQDVIEILRAGQLGKRRLLLLAVIRAFRDSPGAGQLDRALGLFEAVERAAPQVAEGILSHPMVSAWATRCLNGLGEPDLGYLYAMAAAAAAHAGISFEISIPCRNGWLFLPALGAAHDLGDGVAVVSGSAGRLEVTGPCGSAFEVGDDPRWMPIRRITTTTKGARLVLDVDDLDPYRAEYPWPPTHRLAPEQADRLTSLVGEAWEWIVLHCPRYAPSIAGLLRAIVPVAVSGETHQVSAAARATCGAIALSEPRDADAIAQLMIHEIQHAKLDAVMDLVDLYTPGGRCRHRAPWRLDPRPVGALLQGTYAHLGVTDVWRTRRVRPWCGTRPMADFEFTYWRSQTSRAISTLQDSGELTLPGAEFVEAMAETLATWEGEPLPADVVAAAADVDRATAVRWWLHNVVPDSEAVAMLAAAWRAGGVAVLPAPARPPLGPSRPAELGGLAAEIARRASGLTVDCPILLGSERRDGASACTTLDEGAGVSSPDSVAAAHRAFLAGDYASASVSYRRRLSETPDDNQAWVGLTLSLFHSHAGDEKSTAAVRGLLARPELVRAVYAALVGDSSPTPDGVAAWLAGGYGAKESPRAVAVRCSS